jgi:hypothetical protein
MPSRKSIHTAKWHRCVEKVGNKSGGNAYAICTAGLGKSGTFKPSYSKSKR